MRRDALFARNLAAMDHLEALLVAAVTAVLSIRLYLSLSGYPQVGGARFHVAHMLWGGLLLLVALVVLISFLGKSSDRLAAVLGGLGFGTFIDEVGKFVTRDTNYFFRPAIAMIYVSLILLFLVIHAIHARGGYSPTEYLLNALQETEELALHDMDRAEKQRALAYLDRSDPSNPLVVALRELLPRVQPSADRAPPLWTRWARSLGSLYQRISCKPWFTSAIVVFFAGKLVFTLAYALLTVFVLRYGMGRLPAAGFLARLTHPLDHVSFVDLAQLASLVLSGVFVLLGVLRIRHSRLDAFRQFERSVLVSIFLVQVFSFYSRQLAALVGLAVNVLVLVAVRYIVARERRGGLPARSA
jgi:hypothetical protein